MEQPITCIVNDAVTARVAHIDDSPLEALELKFTKGNHTQTVACNMGAAIRLYKELRRLLTE